MRGRQNLWGYAFLAPQLIGLILFSLIPVLFTLTLSFMKWDGFGAKEFIGLANYIDQFQDPDFWKALGNTVYYTILVIPDRKSVV